MDFFLVILHGSTLYWSWLCYHLIMDLHLCLVAMIVFIRSLLPWIYIVLVSSHVTSHMRFESMTLQLIPSNILALDFFTLQSIHLLHSSNFMLWGDILLHRNLTLLIHVLTLFLIPKFLSAKLDCYWGCFYLFPSLGRLMLFLFMIGALMVIFPFMLGVSVALFPLCKVCWCFVSYY